MPLVAGIDSSTQSVKIVVRDADSGRLVRSARGPHPAGTEVDPRAWEAALAEASAGMLDDVAAIAVGGQQHGMVLLDEGGEVVRPALLWNDVRSADACRDLVSELGGGAAWADAVGSVPVASFTVTKLRWVAEHEPDAAARTTAVCLPHDWLTWRLRGERDLGALTTDRGDASGTGYWSPRDGDYRLDLLERAFGRTVQVPRVAGPSEPVGRTAGGALLAPGTGDNMAAALGLGARPGDVVVSLGTSGTVFAVSDVPAADSSGAVAGFADAAGQFLPLVCTMNAARVLEAAASLLGTDLEGVDALARQAEPGAGGLTVLPYLEGERTPDRPAARGTVDGLTPDNGSPANVARAFVEGMLCGLADGLDQLLSQGVEARRLLLIGGAARSRAVQEVASALFGLPVTVPPVGEYVADGAARQAAWTLAGTEQPPAWALGDTVEVDARPTPHVRAAYASLRERTAAW